MQWVFYLSASLAVLWLPFWLPISVRGGAQHHKMPQGSTHLAEAVQAGPPVEGPATKGSPPPSGKVDAYSGSHVSSANNLNRLSSEGVRNRPVGGSCSEVQDPRGGLCPTAVKAPSGLWALMKRREVWAICICQVNHTYSFRF